MSKRKGLVLIASVALVTGVLAGCGGKKKDNSSISSSINDSSDNVNSSVVNSSTNPASSSIYDPDDPKNSTSAGSIVKDSDFSRALNYNYNNYTLVYDQLYNNESVEEYGYIYYVNGISYVLDYTNIESTGFRYSYYANYEGDGYMHWFKEDGYVYDGWVANGYRDSDLAMYHAYFDFERFISTINKDDVEYILGAFYVKEASMQKFYQQGLEFFGDPFFGAEPITTIAFLTDRETGRITKILGACDEKSDNGFVIELAEFGSTVLPQNVKTVRAPYKNSDSDRNIYTYAEMLGDKYVPDVWPTGVTLEVVGEVEKEAGFDAVIDIAESVELAYTIAPANANRIEFDWVCSDEEIVDLNYKANFTSHHKYATGIKEGEALVSIKVQVEGGKWIESNKIKVKVKPLAEQNKENAVYDLTITGSQYKKETIDGKEVEDKNTTIFSAYNAITTTAKFSIKAHNAQAFEAKNSDSFGDSGMIMVVSPAAQEYMNNGFYTEVIFDFGDQEVVSMSFYYALYKSNQRGGALSNMKEAYISTSSDGETWSDPIDMKAEMQSNFENVNLDYEAQTKLMSRTFLKASKVKMYFKANMVGNNYWIAMNSFVFSKDSTCHNHDDASNPVTKVNATASATKAKIGDTIQFGATVEPENATYSNVTWISTNPEVGTINAMGVFTAVSEGKTKVYAQAHNGVKSEEFEIEVVGQEYLDAKYVGKKYVARDVYENSKSWDITLEIPTNATAVLTLKTGTTTTTINFDYYTKDDSTNPLHTFKGQNNEILEVEFHSDSLEFFLKNSSVASFGNTHTNTGEELKLFVAATSIRLTHNTQPVSAIDLKVNETYTFYATVQPTNAFNKTCTATSNNEAVATVVKEESAFKVTAIGSGTAVITVTNEDGASATLTVNVAAVVALDSMTLAATKTSIEAGQTTQVTVTLNPTNANNTNLVFSSSNTNIARVNANADGVSATVTGVAQGSAIITVRDTVSGKTATVTITVTASTAAIDVRYVGTYYGYTDDAEYFEFVVNADGTAVLTVYTGDDADSDIDRQFAFTAMSVIFDGNNITFTYDEDDSIKLGIYNNTLYVYDEDLELGIAYGDTLEIEKA